MGILRWMGEASGYPGWSLYEENLGNSLLRISAFDAEGKHFNVVHSSREFAIRRLREILLQNLGPPAGAGDGGGRPSAEEGSSPSAGESEEGDDAEQNAEKVDTDAAPPATEG